MLQKSGDFHGSYHEIQSVYATVEAFKYTEFSIFLTSTTEGIYSAKEIIEDIGVLKLNLIILCLLMPSVKITTRSLSN